MAKNEINRYKKAAQDMVVISDTGMMPPHDERMEEVVLGAMLIDSNAYARVYNQLSAETFYNKKNRYVYEAIAELAQEKVGIDMLTVTEKLTSEGKLEEAGGANYVVELTGKINSSAHVEYHASLLREMSIARQMITFCADVEQKCFYRESPMRDLLQQTEEKLYSLMLENDRQAYYGVNDVLGKVLKEMEHSSTNDGMDGVLSGFRYLDMYYSGGWQNSDLIIIAARPAMGKTAFVISMAKNMLENEVPVGIFSLEMSKEQIVKRLIVNSTNLSANKVKSGKLNQMDWMVLNHQLGKISKMPLYIDDTANMTIFELCTKARKMVRENGVKCIFIDYLQLMRADGKNINNREQEISSISRTLKQLAKELNIPVIALSQLNRGVEARTGDNKRPMLADLRESGAIEQDADMVILLHRPEYYNILQDEEGNSTLGVAELIVAKNRNGQTGTVKVNFKGEYMKFEDFEYVYEDSTHLAKEDDPLYGETIESEKTEKKRPTKKTPKKEIEDTKWDIDLERED